MPDEITQERPEEKSQNDKQKNLSRNSFMKGSIAAIGGVMTAAYTIPALGFIAGPSLQQAEEEWIRLGSASKVEPGEPVLFKATLELKTGWITDTIEYQVYIRTEDGQNFEAISNICTHLGCRVRWIKNEEVFFCPCHNAEFDRDGEVIDGPPPRPLDRYEVKVEDDQIYIKGG